MGFDDYLGKGFPREVPFVRFYTWSRDTISVGKFQDPAKRLDLDLCRDENIDVVKRPTGGKELLHGNDLCYSVIWPVDGPGKAVRAAGLFSEINEILVAALRKLGIDGECREVSRVGQGYRGPCFTQIDRGEISVAGKKLIASAQRVYDNAVLQQGSMPLRSSGIDLARYLKSYNREDVRGRLSATTTSFFEQADETFSLESIVDVFRDEFEAGLGLEVRPFDKELTEYESRFLETENINPKNESAESGR